VPEPFPTEFIYDEADLPRGSAWDMRRVIEGVERGDIADDFLAFFDRDPERTSPVDPTLVLAPADGLVELQRPVGRVAQFVVHLRLTDVHVQRVPFAGRVLSIERTGRGHFYPDDPKYWTGVQVVTTIESTLGVYRVRQLTTLITRRIETWVTPGEEVKAGQRLGRIRLGSTVILELPGDWEPLVTDRDKVYGATTPLARLRPQQPA
jgi:phosphatidylserine decarboxylase